MVGRLARVAESGLGEDVEILGFGMVLLLASVFARRIRASGERRMVGLLMAWYLEGDIACRRALRKVN